jgi:hypothetical protein
MARIVGIFENDSAVNAVVEQLEFNGITQITVIDGEHNGQDITHQLRGLGVPDQQVGEYHTRLQDQRRLLFVQVSALELPMVQRALRSGQALDIDLLPESIA